ncbi:acyl-CoA desaturase [Candidatus Poribacteria bacterium]|nr:acyl-CoA desaturase [Candidatus Poribacteria bacterium]
MYLKTATVLAWFLGSYALLVFTPVPLWLGILLAASVGISSASVGFNVQHDGGHKAYSDRPAINKLTAMTLDLLGASSYIWNQKHNYMHHMFANIMGHDDDIELGFFGRLSPHHKHLFFHRFQHVYLWVLYGFISVKWQLLDDFTQLAKGRIGQYPLPRPKGWDLAVFIGGKLTYCSLAFVIPSFFHPFWIVALFYLGILFLQGVILSVVFQLAHTVEEAGFPLPEPETHMMEDAWFIHQIHTTVDFARNNKLVSWFVGGLNFQVEHHLFPKVCHIHYPAISRIVEETCAEFGVRYQAHKTVLRSIVSHYRWLYRMGQQESV